MNTYVKLVKGKNTPNMSACKYTSILCLCSVRLIFTRVTLYTQLSSTQM